MYFRGSSGVLLSSLICLMMISVEAHTNLAYPVPTTRGICRIGGEEPYIVNCPGPCREVRSSETSADKPAATWERGEKTMVKWHKNNHHGGFVRLTLVPHEKMMDKKAHSDFAFWYGCFDTGKHRCENKFDSKECGSDKQGFAFETNITVPENLPDGKYILGLSWYGGVTGNSKASYFGDYWACSHVTIQGGASLKSSWKPFWDGDKCVSSVNKLGECEREPCRGKGVRSMTPAKFEKSVSNQDDDGNETEVDEKKNDDEAAKETTAAEETTAADQSEDIRIQGLMLYDIGSNQQKSHDFSKPIDVKMYENGFTLVADITGSIKNIDRVEFSVDGSLVQTERFQPYTLSGDTDGTVERWNYPNKEKIEVKVEVLPNSGDSIEKLFKVYLNL